jgi:hypothetical protein
MKSFSLDNGAQLKTGNIAFPGISSWQWKIRELRNLASFTARMEHKWSTRENVDPETPERQHTRVSHEKRCGNPGSCEICAAPFVLMQW